MKSFYTALFSILLFTITDAQQIAFPGAEGFGKYAVGGRGGKVVEVTNLNDAGAGSFRQAFNEYPGEPITIVFRVSGIIDLASPIKITRSNITVAGQTAPGDGICLKGNSFILNGARQASLGGNHGNIIIRYIRSRPGSTLSTGVYGFDMENCHDVIVDHCSFSWANEEDAALYDTKNTSVQWCIVSEGLYNAGHAKGVRSYGGVWGGQYASYHHNLSAHNVSRTTRFDGARAHDTIALVDYRNNVIYNWGSSSACYGGEVEIIGGLSNVNMVNNYYKKGPATASTLKFVQASYTAASAVDIGKWYIDGNIMYGNAGMTADNWTAVDLSKLPAAQRPNAKSLTPFPVSVALPVNSGLGTFDSVMAAVGAIMPKRDSVDTRVIHEANTGTATGIGSYGLPGIIDLPSAVGGWPVYNSTIAALDNDHDGMADEWELQRGLNPADSADGNLFHSCGYTHLELFLNGDSIVATGSLNSCVDAKPVNANNSGNWIAIKDTTYTRLIATDTSNFIASVLDNQNAGVFHASYYVSNAIRLYNGNAYLNRNITLLPASGSTTSSPLTVRLYFTTAEYNALTAADPSITGINSLRVYLSNSNTCLNTISGTLATIIPTSSAVFGTYLNGYYLEFSTSNFGSFFIAGNNFLLPLRLISFTGNLKSSKVQLNWETSNEINTQQFIVEKTNDAKYFKPIATVAAKNNSNKNAYSVIDEQPFAGISYYRLKMMDKDGAFTYSNIVSITNNVVGNLSLYPNPAKNTITVTHPISANEAILEISTVDGKKIYTQQVRINSCNSFIDVSKLIAGSYILTYINKDKSIMVHFNK